MEGRYNKRSPAVKRLMREAQELSEPTDQYYAQPLEDNLFEWHFTVRGPADSDFQHGVYHGRIILPVDYPMKPPSIIWLTPNGRFETNKKICLSISGHHPESWQPSWSIRTALLAIIGFMPTRPGGAIGSLDYTPEERRALAKKSQDWMCPVCGRIANLLLERKTESSGQPSQETKDLAAQIQFEGEKPKGECSITASCAAASAPTSQPSTSAPPAVEAATTSASKQPPATGQREPEQPPQSVEARPGYPYYHPWSLPPPQSAPVPPAFSPAVPWPGGQLPSPGSPLAMTPRFPLPPSQQPGGMLPMQCFMPGFLPMVPAVMAIGGSFPPNVSPFPAAHPPMSVPAQQAGASAAWNESAAPAEPSSASPSDVNETASDIPAGSPSQGAQRGNDKAEAAGASKPVTSVCKEENKGKALAQTDCDEVLTAVSKAGFDDNGREGSLPPSEKSFIVNGEAESLQPLSKDGDGTEHNQPDLPEDREAGEDSSEAGIAPLDLSELEHTRSSYLERSVSSSVPDLEKKSKLLQKGLRQRQSATATVPTTEAGTSELGAEGGGQRIEAASGDTHPRLIRAGPHTPRAFMEARVLHRNAIARSTQSRGVSRTQYDTSFFVMLVLGVVTALILLNRLLGSMDWSLLL